MELNLRKARKLEAKIAETVAKMTLASAVKVRTLSSDEERDAVLSEGRSNLLAEIKNREDLIRARFLIRRQIGIANAETGVNVLIGLREEAQALLANSTASLDAANHRELRDLAQARKKRLESGDTSRYDDGVTFAAAVVSEEDVTSFKKQDSYLKKEIENLEDQLSQKNLGTKITLVSHVVELLKKNDLI